MTESTDEWLRMFFNGEPLPPVNAADTWFQRMQHHGMIPLLVDAAEQRQLTLPDAPRCLDQARQEFVHDSELRRELKEIDHLFSANGVTAAVLKGTAVAINRYPRPGLRPRSDTDLLVEPEQFEHSQQMLAEIGYVRMPGQAGGVSSAVTLLRESRFGRAAMLDLHTDVVNLPHPINAFLNMARVRQQGQLLPGYEVVWQLSDRDALLLAIMHRAQNFSYHGERFIWLYDIKVLIDQLEPAAWLQLCEDARKLELGSAVNHTMTAARYWLAVAAPGPLLAEDTSAEFFVADPDDGVRTRLRVALAAIDNWPDRLAFLWYKVFPPVSFLRYSNPGQSLLRIYIQRMRRAARLVWRSWKPSRESSDTISS